MQKDYYQENDFEEDGYSGWDENQSPVPLPIPLLLLISFVGILLLSLFGNGTTTTGRAEGELDSSSARYAAHPGISPLFTPEVHYWGDAILQWASQTDLDPNLIATVMQIESCGNPRAASSVGATGLFQVMPYHFEEGENPYNPQTNALRGLNYLKKSLETANGNFRLAFAGYNGGIGVIARPESSWASETQRYAYWGSGIYADALQGASRSARLDEWLNAGGSSLCASARQYQ